MIDRRGHARRPRPMLPIRVAFAGAVVSLLSLLMALPAMAAVPSASLVPVDTGFTNPLLVTNAGDGSGRLFVVEKRGLIKIIESGTTRRHRSLTSAPRSAPTASAGSSGWPSTRHSRP